MQCVRTVAASPTLHGSGMGQPTSLGACICDAMRARAQREVHASSEPSYLPPPPAGSVRRPVGGEREGGGVKIWPPRFLADSAHVGHTRHCLNT